jgi:hypothetical protein
MEAEQIKQGLRQFTGTTQYTRYQSNLLLTDGIVYLAEHAHCFWLLDLFASYLSSIDGNQEWLVVLKLTRNGDGALAVIEDGNGKLFGRQEIEWTDFPLDSITIDGCWSDEHWVVMLPYEY